MCRPVLLDTAGGGKLWTISAGMVIATVAFLLYRNNVDPERVEASRELQEEIAVETASDTAGEPEATVNLESVAKQVVSEDTAPRTAPVVTLPGVRCRVFGRPGMQLVISADLILHGSADRHEVLSQREVLRTVMQKTTASRNVDKMNVQELARDLTAAMNGALEKEYIDRIVFSEFRLE